MTVEEIRKMPNGFGKMVRIAGLEPALRFSVD